MRFKWITDKGFSTIVYNIRNTTNREMVVIFEICEKTLPQKFTLMRLVKAAGYLLISIFFT
jgi:hypothetical protein